MKKQLKCTSYKMLFMLFVMMTTTLLMTACSASTEPQEDTEAPLAAEPTRFTIHLLDRTNPRNGFVLTDILADEEIEIEFERAENDWWKASFYSEADVLQLELSGLSSWQTPFDQSFVLTTSFPTIYVFGTEMVSLVYTYLQEDSYLEFTVISWQEKVEIAGTFNDWTPTEISEADESLLSMLTPTGAQANPTRNIYSGRFVVEEGTHEFKMLRNEIWSNGENATVVISND